MKPSATAPVRFLQMMCILFCVIATGCASGSRPGAATAPPSNLRIDDAANPVGVGATPNFGWHVNDPNPSEIQSKYQILVASSQARLDSNTGDLWDSGQVASRQQNRIAYAGKPLAADSRYFWKVRTWDKDSNASDFSAAAHFVVGPVKNEDWSAAKWIRRTNTNTDDHTYYRKKASIPSKPISRATVYVSSAHRYALYINGAAVGKGPALHFPQYQYYNGYDITRLIEPGKENLFAIYNHWFGGGQGRAASARGVIMKAVVHHTDGSTTIVGTDSSWKQSQATAWVLGNQQHNAGEGVGFIERIDAAKLTPTWNQQNFDDSSWAAADEIGAHPSAPWTNPLRPDLTRITETEITPASVTDKGNGKYVVDIGKVWAGMPKITFSGGQAGTVVNMQAGYGLTPAGEVDTRRNQNTALRYFTILNGQTFTYAPVEYFGMRYFQIENSPMPVTKENFKFITRHSAMDDKASSFTSSNPTLNAVWDFMKHSLYTCAQEVFVDTPSREKGGFLGDGAIQSTVAMPVLNERLLSSRAIRQFLDSMDQNWSTDENRGRMNAVYPNNDGARDIPDFTEAYLVWVWEYYMETGDKQFLADNFTKFKNIADYLHRYVDANTGLITNLRGGSGQYQFGIIDWPASMRFGYDMTAARTVVNEWAYADYDIVSKIASELGNNADRDAYRQRADTIREKINSQLINSAGVYVDGLNATRAQSAHASQQANMFPLALHIVPPANLQAVKDHVKAGKMSVGMVTVMWLMRALGESDEGQHLVDIYTNPEWNGWARCLARGATATWETWDSDTDGQSESHAWGAAGLYGYTHYILGIAPLKPQYEHIQIKPLDFGAKLTSAKGTLPTDRGNISVDWNRENNRHTLKVTIPPNVTADVYVPKLTGTDATVEMNGSRSTGVIEGNYIRLSAMGSGAHTIVRAARP